MRPGGTILTRPKALEFSSGVITDDATFGFLGMYSVNAPYGEEIDITKAAKEAEEFRTQLNLGRNRYSYSEEYSSGSHRALDRLLGTESNKEIESLTMFQRKLAPPLAGEFEPPGRFNYEDLTEEQAGRELERILQGIEERGEGLRTWIKVKKAQLLNKRK
tara:strand:- start:840 stop:1322 length:483 start_codon:yes stop_codon:yes gene_type:complete